MSSQLSPGSLSEPRSQEFSRGYLYPTPFSCIFPFILRALSDPAPFFHPTALSHPGPYLCDYFLSPLKQKVRILQKLFYNDEFLQYEKLKQIWLKGIAIFKKSSLRIGLRICDKSLITY